ncbi:MAG: LuxR C-terminal-related transcriptional regulator [Treponema sp.]|nr:LuxR C-terminal-related transcriptional regulator [Treponema sp.]
MLDKNNRFDNRQIIERKQIHKLLENSVQKAAVFITAGSGYGKTCAVHSFLQYKNETAIWLTLTEKDNEPLHFWNSLIQAVSLHNPRVGKYLEELGFPESPAKITCCLSVLADEGPNRKFPCIVADNFHHITEKSILEFVSRIAASPYPKGTIIFISEREPELNTMSLLSKGLLSRITADDLRFNEEEIAAYFRLKNINLSSDDAQDIFIDTEGWALAVRLVAEEMETIKSLHYNRAVLSDGKIAEMIDELFNSMSISYQRFFTIISLFDQWPLEVMSKITEWLNSISSETSHETLPPPNEQTVRLHLLSALYYYDVYLHGFKMHSLFLDYLRNKHGALSHKEIKSACSIMAQWCVENRLLIDAAINYGIAGDCNGIFTAIYSSPRIISPATAESFLEIIDRLISNSETDKHVEQLNQSNELKQNNNNEKFLILQHVTRAGLLLNSGRYDESKDSLEKSIGEFELLPPNPLNFLILSSCYNTLGALAIFSSRTHKNTTLAVKYFRLGNFYYMCSPYTVSGSMSKTSIGSYANLIGYPTEENEFEQYIDTVSQCIPYASHSIGGYLSGVDSLCRAELAYFRGELDTAEQHAREAVIKAREKGQYEIESKSLFYLLRVYLCTGNITAGRETWAQVEAIIDIPDYINRYAIYDIMTGWIYAHIGAVGRIAPWLRSEFEKSDLNPNYQNYEMLVKAKSLFAEKRYADTINFLEREDVRDGIGAFCLGALEIAVLKMAAFSRDGDDAAVREMLETAYTIALEGSRSGKMFDMPFIELGEDMRSIASAALSALDTMSAAPTSAEHGLNREWLLSIRSKAAGYAKKLSTATEQYCKVCKENDIPFFTAQELSVLTSISKGLTREKIAEGASLSASTVKKIIKTIYTKLGAINRADAIRIATSFGLLK